MRTYAPFAFAIGLLVVCDLPAQGRGRRGQRPDNAQPMAASAPQPAAEADKKPKTHLAIVGGDVFTAAGRVVLRGLYFGIGGPDVWEYAILWMRKKLGRERTVPVAGVDKPHE